MTAHRLRLFMCCVLLLGSACPSSDESSGGDAGPNGDDAGLAADGGSGGASGGGAGSGAGGAAGKGSAGNGGSAGSESGTGGSDTDAGADGPGVLDAEGDVFCLADQAALSAAFYFGTKKQCLIYDMTDGAISADGKTAAEYDCTSTYMGTIVDACPSAGRVAYCGSARTTIAGVMQQKIVYESEVNPSAAAVARNSLAVCAINPAYDLDDHPLVAQCNGKLSAKVDGKLIDFSARLTCLFKTDGTQFSYFVRGTDKLNDPSSKELTIYVLKTGDKVELKTELGAIGFGYLEGTGASGAFATSVAGETPTYTSKTLDAEGAALSGSFELGKLSGGGGATRDITAGTLDITLDLL